MWARRSVGSALVVCAVLAVLLGCLPILAGCGDEPETTLPPGATTSDTGAPPTVPEEAIPASLALTGKDDGKDFTIAAGGTITLTLAANPSTGYGWEMDLADIEDSLLEQVGEPAFESDDAKAVGAAGKMTFTFRAADRGEMDLRMDYLPPDGGDAKESFAVHLTVK